MIDYMVIALPRSGTAWVANLLTTGDDICLHESFMTETLETLDNKEHSGLLGISETSAIFFEDEINRHPAKKLIIERPLDEINNSLINLGLYTFTPEINSLLNNIEGYKISFNDLFNEDVMGKAYKFLTGKEMNKDRHKLLCSFGVQNIFAIEAVRNML
jgi:hypothetical protein